MRDLLTIIVLFILALVAGFFWRRHIWLLVVAAFATGLTVALVQFDEWASVKHDITNFTEFLMSCGVLLVFFGAWYVPAIVGALLGFGSRFLFRRL
jgi:hypothetical protein